MSTGQEQPLCPCKMLPNLDSPIPTSALGTHTNKIGHSGSWHPLANIKLMITTETGNDTTRFSVFTPTWLVSPQRPKPADDLLGASEKLLRLKIKLKKPNYGCFHKSFVTITEKQAGITLFSLPTLPLLSP